VDQVADLRASYADAHRYDGAAIQRDRVDEVVPCAVQPRDIAPGHPDRVPKVRRVRLRGAQMLPDESGQLALIPRSP
jgi:hypothetical protein